MLGMRQRSCSIDSLMRGESGETHSPSINSNFNKENKTSSDAGALEDYLVAEGSDLGSPAHNDECKPDVRELLFDDIPLPYFVPTQYQRIQIEELESVDDDSSDACRKLKRCLNLRDKWISRHPVPPQDLVRDFDGVQPVEPGTPLRPRKRLTPVS